MGRAGRVRVGLVALAHTVARGCAPQRAGTRARTVWDGGTALLACDCDARAAFHVFMLCYRVNA